MEMSTKWNIGLVEDWNFGKPADTGHTLIATLRPLSPALSPSTGDREALSSCWDCGCFPLSPAEGERAGVRGSCYCFLYGRSSEK